MVQTILNLGEKQNRIVNIVKGINGFKNKSEAINFIINEYAEKFLSSEFTKKN